MKKLLCMAVSVLLLCSLFASCQKKPVVSVGEEGRYVLNLSEELDNNQMELKSIPWLSSPEDVIDTFGLSLNEVLIEEGQFYGDRRGVRMYLPVYLEDLEASANLTLFFRTNYPVLKKGKTLERALTIVELTTQFADEAEEAAYFEKLKAMADFLEENRPDTYQHREGKEWFSFDFRSPDDSRLPHFEHGFGTCQAPIKVSEKKVYMGCRLLLDIKQRNPDYEFGSEENGDRWI